MRSILRLLKTLLPDQHPLRLLWHKSKALAAAVRYGFPARKLTVIGITGTDGKTTTVGMTAHILQECGYQTGALSTAYFRIKDRVEWNATQKTSPSPFTVQAFLARLVREGCTHAVLEYSSHGLVQGRTLWTHPRVAGFTNLTPEHLDYHKTMEDYRAAKGLLFRMLKGKGVKVLNAADAATEAYRRIPTQRTILYGAQPGKTDAHETLWAAEIAAQASGTHARAAYRSDVAHEERTNLHLPVPGAFNVDNALCAIGCAMGAGVPFMDAVRSLGGFPGIPGRMERITEGQPFHVFVDFTVTPASYERTLGTLREMAQDGARLIVVMGSCGDRMKEKRPEIGEIASRLADRVIVTNEDPYTEDPETIIDAVLAGVDKASCESHRIVDRLEAIRFAFAQAKPGDIVLLAGKGSDTTMWVRQGQIPWNEREIAREELKRLAQASLAV